MVESLEGRELLTQLLALTADNTLRTFDDSRVDIQLGPAVPVTGLQSGENLLQITYRPGTGQFYGFGSSDRFYSIDPATGAATAVGPPLSVPVRGDVTEIYFDSLTAIGLNTDVGQRLDYDIFTGATTAFSDVTYIASDPGAGLVPDIVANAGNIAIDGRRAAFVAFELPADELFTVGSTGFTPVGDVGLAETEYHGVYVSARPNPTSDYNLYVESTDTTLVKFASFPSGVSIRDIVIQAPQQFTARALTSDNRLVSFHTDAPGAILASVPITGTEAGETIAALSYRTATGVLYGFGTAGRLYTIDAATGVASAVSTTPVTPAYDGTKVSLTQLPTSDTFLVTTKGGQQLLLDPSTGAVTGTGTDLMYPSDDPKGAGQASVVSEAYIPLVLNFGTGTFDYSAIFAIDSERDTLVRHIPPAGGGSGQTRTDQPLGLDVTDDVSQDTIQGVNFLILNGVGSTASTLYLYNPAPYFTDGTPQLTRVADIGGATIRDFALAPVGDTAFASAAYTVSGDSTSATITVNRTGGSVGTVRFSYLTNGGTAVPGTDYTPVSGVLTFGDGETSKTFVVPITPNSVTSGSRTVNLLLSPDGLPGLVASTATLTITAAPIVTPIPPPNPVPAATLASATFVGSALAITGVDLKFDGPIDAARAADPANFQVGGATPGRISYVFNVTSRSATYDPATSTVHLTFDSPIALLTFRILNVLALGFGPGRANSSVGFDIVEGRRVNYLENDGDRVTLSVTGRNALVVVLRPLGGAAPSVFVNGPGKIVTGTFKARRGSNHKATIARFVAGRAKLRLSPAISVGELVRT